MRASLAPPGVRAVYGACAGRLKTAPSHVGEAATDAAVAAKNPWGGRGGGGVEGSRGPVQRPLPQQWATLRDTKQEAEAL